MMRPTRPRARARWRFRVGPSSAKAVTITRSSPFQCRSGRDSAFATADRSTFSTSSATARFENARMVRASGTERPRMRSVTSRALRALECTYFAWARTICRCVSTAAIASLPLDLRLAVAGVTLEGARRRELAQFVADHLLGHEHGDVLAAIVDGDRVADHLREDG